jgi:hypothetical protein
MRYRCLQHKEAPLHGQLESGVRRSSFRRLGLPALSCIADFTAGGLPIAEYLVWIRGEKATALFFGRSAKGEFDASRERFDRVIETAKIP